MTYTWEQVSKLTGLSTDDLGALSSGLDHGDHLTEGGEVTEQGLRVLLAQAISADLAGTREIADALGVSRGLVAVWQGRHADFPKPVAHLASGRIYLLPEVLAWHAARQPCPACNARPHDPCSFDCIGLAASKES